MSWILDLEHQCGAKKLWLWDVRTDLLLFQLWKLRWCLVVRNRDENRLLFKVKSDVELTTSQGFIFSGAPWVELLLASAMVLLTASSPKGIWKLIPQGGDPKSGALEKWASPENCPQRWASGLQKDRKKPAEAFSPLHLLPRGVSTKKRSYQWSSPYHTT